MSGSENVVVGSCATSGSRFLRTREILPVSLIYLNSFFRDIDYHSYNKCALTSRSREVRRQRGTTFGAANRWRAILQMCIMRCMNLTCGRPFQLNEFQFSTEVSLPWKRGEITCPHCGVLTAGDAKSVFLSHPLSSTQETEYNRQADNGSNVIANSTQDSAAREGNVPKRNTKG